MRRPDPTGVKDTALRTTERRPNPNPNPNPRGEPSQNLRNPRNPRQQKIDAGWIGAACEKNSDNSNNNDNFMKINKNMAM